MTLRASEDRWLAPVVGSSCILYSLSPSLSHFFLNLCWFVASGAESGVVIFISAALGGSAVGAGISVYEATDAGTVVLLPGGCLWLGGALVSHLPASCALMCVHVRACACMCV